jgi:hypothetical protein
MDQRAWRSKQTAPIEALGGWPCVLSQAQQILVKACACVGVHRLDGSVDEIEYTHRVPCKPRRKARAGSSEIEQRDRRAGSGWDVWQLAPTIFQLNAVTVWVKAEYPSEIGFPMDGEVHLPFAQYVFSVIE